MENNKPILKLVIIFIIIIWASSTYYFLSTSQNNWEKTIPTKNIEITDKQDKTIIPWVHPDLSDNSIWDKWIAITKEEQEEALIKNKLDEILINKIQSFLRTFCSSYKDVKLLVKSRHFKTLREKVNNYSKKNDRFTYVKLPWLVYSNCKNKDFEYLETLIMFLQLSDEELKNVSDWLYRANLKKYIEDISIIDEDIPKNIRSDSKVFNKYFLNKKVKDLSAFYFPYYIKEQQNLSSYVARPILTFEDENASNKLAIELFVSQLKEIWFKSYDEFKNTLLRNTELNSVDELKESIKNDFNNIISSDSDLKDYLNNLEKYKKFIISKDYKKLFKNTETSNLMNSLWKKMLILSIISDDYADWLGETWSWQKFFWDEEIWNWIIRLHFIYMLNL